MPFEYFFSASAACTLLGICYPGLLSVELKHWTASICISCDVWWNRSLASPRWHCNTSDEGAASFCGRRQNSTDFRTWNQISAKLLQYWILNSRFHFLNKGSQGLDVGRSILIRSNKIGILTLFCVIFFHGFFSKRPRMGNKMKTFLWTKSFEQNFDLFSFNMPPPSKDKLSHSFI